jgi:hypothetical protein
MLVYEGAPERIVKEVYNILEEEWRVGMEWPAQIVQDE